MVAFANGVNMGLDQELNQERGLRIHNQEAIKEKKPCSARVSVARPEGLEPPTF
jgi:hypothetical protein